MLAKEMVTSPCPVNATTAPESAARARFEAAMIRAEWQPRLFGPVSRAELLKLTPAWPCRGARVRVHRNHGFDAVASAVAKTGASIERVMFCLLQPAACSREMRAAAGGCES